MMNRLLLLPPPRVGFSVLLFVGLGLLGLQWTQHWLAPAQPNTSVAAAQENLLQVTHELAAQQQRTLTQIHEQLRVLAGLSITTLNPAACARILTHQLDRLPAIENLLVLDSQGGVRCSALSVSELPTQDFLNAAIGQHALAPILSAHKIFFAAPLLSPAGYIEGSVLAVAPRATWLRANQGALPAAMSLTLLDQSGRVLITEARDLTDLRARPEPGVKTLFDNQGAEYWQAVAPLNGPARGLSLMARQAPPNIVLETTSALVGLVGLTLLMLASIAAFRLAQSRFTPWWQVTQKKYGDLPANILHRMRKRLPRVSGDSVTVLRRSNADLKRALAAQELRNLQLQRLALLSQMLLSSASLREAANTVSQCARELFPHSGGALLLRTRPGVVETAVSWGHAAQHEFSRPEDCWAQRLGRTYAVTQAQGASCCAHLKTSAPVAYICVPLIAQGELFGTLHLQAAATSGEAPTQWLAESLAQRVAGAMSRIQREALLRAQATRDPLTGLHNRRFLEETLALEELRAKRQGAPVGVMILDIDLFKRFNDTFGHDAGDALLRALGRTIRSQVRKGDIPCRYGGEEFVIVLPGADLEITVARAEALRRAVSALQVSHDGQALGPVTVSIGVACYPRHGADFQRVLKVADQALYAGKHAGRDRVMRPTPTLASV